MEIIKITLTIYIQNSFSSASQKAESKNKAALYSQTLYCYTIYASKFIMMKNHFWTRNLYAIDILGTTYDWVGLCWLVGQYTTSAGNLISLVVMEKCQSIEMRWAWFNSVLGYIVLRIPSSWNSDSIFSSVNLFVLFFFFFHF